MVVAACALAGTLVMAACAEDDARATVLVIGDSLTVGAEIGGLGDDGSISVDAEEGRTTEEAIAVARDADPAEYEHVIVAVGTNDYLDSEAEFAVAIDQMMEVLGPEVPVIWVNVDTGTAKLAPAAEGVNAALAAAASRYDNLTIADWSGYLADQEDPDGLRAGDGVHDSPAGYRLRAAWMASLAPS